MQIKEIIIAPREDCAYDIVIKLMKNNIINGIIRCSDEVILTHLSAYMNLINIPNIYKGKTKLINIGYTLSNRIEGSSSQYHDIYIISHSESVKNSNYNGSLFILKDYEEEFDNTNEILLDSIPVHIQNDEIRRMFIYAFKIAETEINIISPWMNFRVVNSKLIRLMDDALERGVKIRIIYGLKPWENQFSKDRSDKSDLVANKLRDIFERHGTKFSVVRDNIHYKLLLCDEKYKLEGGFNYLSFDGNYKSKSTRKEGSPFGRNVDEIKYLRELYFND